MFNYSRHIALSAIFTLLIGGTVQAQMSASYLYRLSDFNGPVKSLWARLAVDPEQGEVYALNRSGRIIEIYNQTAMQTFGFGEEMQLASATDIASGDNGEIYVLYRFPAGHIKHLDYRGMPIRNIQIKVADFQPEFLDYHDGKLYLADSGSMQVVIADHSGQIENSYDLRTIAAGLINSDAQKKDLNKAQRKKIREDLEVLAGTNMGGFSVGPQGNIYFSLSSLFTAYRYAPGGDLEAFGVPGSAPGKFGVVASLCADSRGNIYVSDRLRSVVLIFDAELQFLAEFGYRGSQPGNLVVPDDIAIDERNQRIYVAEAANRGISVFSYATLTAKSQNSTSASQHLAHNPERRSENEASQTATVDM